MRKRNFRMWLRRPHRDDDVAPVTSRSGNGHDEAGSTLVLALLFLVVIGLLVGGLSSWTANNLTDAVVFQNARSAEFALNSATQLAVQNIRYQPLLNAGQTLNANPPSYCWGSGPPSQYTDNSNGQNISVNVWCSTAWDATGSTITTPSGSSITSTREVTITACLTSVTTDAATCANNPGQQTLVSFDDFATGLSDNCPPTCGASMTILSSGTSSSEPTVTGLTTSPATSPPSGPVSGGTPLTISGSGFVSGATTVYFVNALSNSPQYNVVSTIQPSNVTFNSTSSISVTTSSETTTGTYYVVVATPNGFSLGGTQSPQSAFVFQPVVPQITGMRNTSGSANGGTALSITGSGFLSNGSGDSTVVTFTNTANGAISSTSQNVTVDPTGTIITATTPSITTGTTYYVTVTTSPGGTTPQTSSLQFIYQPFYPIADSITPSSGGSGTAVTVTGLGFVSGGTVVTLIPTGSGSALTLTNVNVSSPSSLTAKVPTTTGNNTYYVSVTTTWNGNTYQSCNANGGGQADDIGNVVPACSSEGTPQYTY